MPQLPWPLLTNIWHQRAPPEHLYPVPSHISVPGVSVPEVSVGAEVLSKTFEGALSCQDTGMSWQAVKCLEPLRGTGFSSPGWLGITGHCQLVKSFISTQPWARSCSVGLQCLSPPIPQFQYTLDNFRSWVIFL